MIIYFVLIILILIIPNKKNNNIKYLLFCSTILIILICFRKQTIGYDLRHHYIINFYAYQQLSWSELKSFGIEIGLPILSKLIGFISNKPQIFIIVTGIISITLTIRFLYKYSPDFKMSLFLYCSYCTMYQYMNQIAQALAVSIILLAFDFLKDKKYLKFIVLVLLASTFHSSALICILMIPLSNIKSIKFSTFILITSTLILLFFYNIIFELSVNLLPQYSWYINSSKHGVGDTSRGVYLKILILLCGILWTLYVTKKSENIKPMHVICLTFSMVTLMFQTITLKMIIMNRLGFYFLSFFFILIPTNLQSSCKNRNIIKLFIYCFMIVYYIYITIKWGDISYGVTPYMFFWQ